MSRLAHPQHPFLPKLRRAVDRAAHMVSQLGYGFLPITIGSWRRVEVEHNVPYRNTSKRAHLLDIYRPRHAEGPLPTVIYIHGGAFSMMSKDTHRVMAYVLASQGYQVFNINYRLGPVHPYPKPLDDAIAAVLWVLDHGEARGADINRLAIMGESAGANLAAALSYCAAHPRPEPFARALYERDIRFRCVAPMYGILDLHDVERFWRDPRKSRRLANWIKREIHGVTHSYLGRRAGRALEFPLASPLRLLETSSPPGSRPLPPFFTTVGTADPLISDTIRLREALDSRGTECDLHVFRGEIHAFDVMLWRESARAKWRALFRFLGRHMNVTPAPPFSAYEPRYPSWADASAG